MFVGRRVYRITCDGITTEVPIEVDSGDIRMVITPEWLTEKGIEGLANAGRMFARYAQDMYWIEYGLYTGDPYPHLSDEILEELESIIDAEDSPLCAMALVAYERTKGGPLEWRDEKRSKRRKEVSKRKRTHLFESANHQCQECGAGWGAGLEIHHITPIADGGTNRPSNLAVLCHACHVAETSRWRKESARARGRRQ